MLYMTRFIDSPGTFDHDDSSLEISRSGMGEPANGLQDDPFVLGLVEYTRSAMAELFDDQPALDTVTVVPTD